MKQIILIRTDCGMGAGKMVAQGAHASVMPFVRQSDPGVYTRLNRWLTCDTGFTKVCLGVSSAEELLELTEKAKSAGLPAYTITDEGRTVFNGVPTLTCGSIGPATKEELDPITGHLELLP